MLLRTAPAPFPTTAPAPRAVPIGVTPLLALLMSATLAACGGGGGGGGAPGNTETAQNLPAPAPAPAPSGPQAAQIDALDDNAQAFHFQVDDSLASEAALQAAAGGSTYSAWNPTGSPELFAAGLKVNFFGRGSGCDLNASNGPVGQGSDAILPVVANATGVSVSAPWRWAPSGGFAPCSTEAQSRQGPNMVTLNPASSAGGGVGLYTRTGPDAEGQTSLLRPFDATGQNGSGANADINGTFVTFRQDWRRSPRYPWLGAGPSAPSAPHCCHTKCGFD